MFRTKIFASLFMVAIALSADAGAFAQGNSPAIKAEVERRIRDNKEKVNIDLTDRTKVRGRLLSSGSDSYTMTDDKTTLSRTLLYSDTARVKGRGMSTGKKVGIIAGVGGGITALVIVLVFHHITRNN